MRWSGVLENLGAIDILQNGDQEILKK